MTHLSVLRSGITRHGVALAAIGAALLMRAWLAPDVDATIGLVLFAGAVLWLSAKLERARTQRETADAAVHAACETSKTEAIFRAVLESAPDAVISVGEDGRIAVVNSETERLFGYSRGELLGSPLEILLPESLRARHVAHRTIYEQDPRTRPMGAGLDLTARRKDGTEFPAEISLSPLPTSDGLMVTAVVRDISEQRKVQDERARLVREQDARAAAEAAERRSLFLADLTAALASSLDYEATLASLARLVVPRLADWCSVDLQRDTGRIEQLAVAHVDPEKVRWAKQLGERRPLDADDPEGVPGVIRTGRSQILPLVTDQFLADRVRDPETLRILREVGIISSMIVPLTSERRAIGAISFTATRESGRHYDRLDLAFAEEVARRAGTAIENARLYREAQEANQLKDDFLATLSHELRTPLNAVLGWTRLLQSGRLGETSTRHALEAIGRNATAQARLINDLLDVSRIVTGKVSLDCAPVALAPIIRDAVDAIRVAANARHVQIEVEADPQVGLVWADRDRLQQVMWNLISNAVKFTPPGGQVLVRLEGRANDIEVTITDTGVGIATEFLPYVFDRFRQADSSSTRTHGGLGLGLAIVRHLVEMHGGTVRAESGGVGKGTTFVFTLPLRAARAVAPEETAAGGACGEVATAGQAELRGIRTSRRN